MNRRCLCFALVGLMSVSPGCSSVPVRYYTLTPPPDRTLAASGSTLPVNVRVVHTPAQLNRDELMLRTGPSEVTLLENERWASPVNEEIKAALRLELQRRLSGMVGLRTAHAKLWLDLDVQHLEAELGRYALFEASWSASLSASGERPAGAPATICTFRAAERIHGGYAGIIEGYQREIAYLAQAIATVLAGQADGIDEACKKSIEGSDG